ncbi:MAG: hypothetical protein LUG85_06060 [Clostridiales bacterium]|nr:hypothetical protein [Clostridiales bacterium]
MKHYIILITSLVFLSMLFIPMTSCKSDDYPTTVVAEYDDGSWIKTLGGPQYAHYLFDGYALYSYEGYFSQLLMKGDDEGTYTIRNYTIIENAAEGYYLMYSFDPSGYIAYYRIQKTIGEDETVLYEKTVGGEIVRIIDEGAFLYDCREGTEYKFNSMNELYDYSETAGINLGQVYYAKGYGSRPEETVAAVNMWSVAKTTWGNFNVKNGKKDIFTGEIK